MSEYSIRRLQEDDWQIFKEIRLRALSQDPFVFGSNYEREVNQSDVEWSEPLNDRSVGLFAIFRGEVPMGITGVSLHRDDPSGRTAILWGSWLSPEVRGQGLSKMFYQARMAWARQHPTVERIIVSHRVSNLSSKFANQKFGFVQTHVTEKVWNDGVTEEEFHYELVL